MAYVTLLSAGVVRKIVIIDWHCHRHWSSFLLRRVNYYGEIVFSAGSSVESVGMLLHVLWCGGFAVLWL